MPQTPHVECHFVGSEVVRDIVIGMSDGLTVPFALAAGLSGAVASAKIVVTAGFAEIAAGSIAMGLGGYLAARSDAEHFENEYQREETEVRTVPEIEAGEVRQILQGYGLTVEEATPVVNALRQRPQAWIDFMMRFELGLEKQDPKRAPASALTIAGAYIGGGLVPLLPYFASPSAHAALPFSVGFTLTALLVFGYVKGRFTGANAMRSAFQTAVVGGLAAAAAYLLAKAIA